MKQIITIIIFLLTTLVFAQEPSKEQQNFLQEITSLKQQLNNQQTVINRQTSELKVLSIKTEAQQGQIDSLKTLSETNFKNIETVSNELGTKIQQTDTHAKASISKLDNDVSKNRLYWIIATLVLLVLGGLIYWLLKKRIQSNKTDVETQIKNTKKTLEEESIKLDNKLIEVLETQLKLKREEKVAVANVSKTASDEIDHSLALKVADEILRMQKNISKIDATTKGLKPLQKGIERIQDNFTSNGYEMIIPLNMEYDERMNIDVINFITDENIPHGKKIITSVIKPQVNFEGILIQRAQVDVSQN